MSKHLIGLGVEKVYHITTDDSFELIGPGGQTANPSASPDKKWFFVFEGENESQHRFTLYSDTYQRVRSWMFENEVTETSWRPDSLGIFLFSDDQVYYLGIPDGEPRQLDVDLPPLPNDCDGPPCTWPWLAWRP